MALVSVLPAAELRIATLDRKAIVLSDRGLERFRIDAYFRR